MAKKRADAIPRKLRKLVLDSIRRHAWNIGVSQYTGDVRYMQADKQTGLDTWIQADITVDRRYLTFTLQLYPRAIKLWREVGDSHIERVISHEIGHLATQHFFDVATATYRDEGEMKDAWETCTEVIGRLALKLDEQLRDDG